MAHPWEEAPLTPLRLGELVLEVLRGEGKLSASLQVSPVTFRISRLPTAVTVTTTVTDPDGRVIEGARAVFTLSVPGLGPITHEATTGATDSSGGVNRGRGFDFNVFASELFNNITVRKTASAEVEEGSLGATATC